MLKLEDIHGVVKIGQQRPTLTRQQSFAFCVHSVHSGTSVTQRVQMEDCLFDNDEYYPAPLFF